MKRAKLSYVVSLQDTRFSAVATGGWISNIRFVAKAGYDGVELAVRDPQIVDLVALNNVLNKCKLGVSAIGTGQAFLADGLSLTAQSKSVRERTHKRLSTHIRMAQYLHCPVIIGLIRGRDRDKLALLGRMLRRLASDADAANVDLLVEPINRYETGLLNTCSETAAFIRDLGVGNVGILADTFHMNIEEADIVQTFSNHSGMIKHCHFADSGRKYPGTGHVDFVSIMKLLDERKYIGYYAAEILQEPNFKTAVMEFKKFFKK